MIDADRFESCVYVLFSTSKKLFVLILGTPRVLFVVKYLTSGLALVSQVIRRV